MNWHASVLVMAAGIGLGAAQPKDSFTGTWKFNPGKSKLTGATDAVAPAGPNAWKFTYGSASWTVKTDGADHPTPFGGTVAMAAKSANVWQLTDKTNGKVVAVETWTLASDGKSMIRVSEGTRENGEHFSDTTHVKRVGGTTGFTGSWEATDIKVSAPGAFEVTASATRLVLNDPAEKVTWSCAFDGKPNPVQGPSVPPGTTISCKRPSSHTIHSESMLNGKHMETDDLVVSADGKMITQTARDAMSGKTFTYVYDRVK